MFFFFLNLVWISLPGVTGLKIRSTVLYSLLYNHVFLCQYLRISKHVDQQCTAIGIPQVVIFFILITFLLDNFCIEYCNEKIAVELLLSCNKCIAITHVLVFGSILRLWRCADLSCWFCKVCSWLTRQTTYKGKGICNSNSFELTKDCPFSKPLLMCAITN